MTVADRKSHAFALMKSGQTRQAETVIKSLFSGGHNDPRLTLQLAHIYAARQDWNAALPLYRQLLEGDPRNADINLSYGSGLLAIRRYRDALEPLRIATTRMPGNGAAGLAYARALKGANAQKQAAGEFARVLPMYDGNAAVIREYGDLLLEQKQYGKAEREYKRALGLGLEDASLYVALSGALRGNRKPREALPYLQKAYALAPTDRLAFELARLHQQLGQSRQAQALLNSIPANGRSRGSE
jgi:Tfp pilus assembly protein PilF